MSEDLTNKLSQSGEDRILGAIKDILGAIKDILGAINDLDTRVGNLDARVGKIDCRLQGLEQGQETMRMNIIELNNMVRNVNLDQILMNDIVRRIQSDFHNFDERLHHFLLNHDRQNSST